MRPSVAAVIVNWRRAEDTVRAVRSLAGSTQLVMPIVVDNGSGDGSAAKMRAALPDAEVLESEANLGFGGGCNVGISRARELGARYVLLLNNDTEAVEPDFLTALVEALESDPRAAVAGPLVHFPDGSVQPTVGRLPSFRYAVRLAVDRPRGAAPLVPGGRVRAEFLAGVCLLVRVEALVQVGGFDETYFMYGEEADLEGRLADAGWSLVFVPVRSIIHHHQDVSDDPVAQVQIRAGFVRFCLDHRGSVSGAAVAAWFLVGALSRDLRRRRWFEVPALAGALGALHSQRGVRRRPAPPPVR